MKIKGFTLVELLAVIVILVLILSIAVPAITNVVENARKSAFESNAKLVLNTIKMKELSDEAFDPTTITADNIKAELNLDDTNYKTVQVTIVNNTQSYNDKTVSVAAIDNKLKVVIEGSNKWDGLVAYGTERNMTVVTKSEYTPPIITAVGDNPLTVELGTNYNEPGATANDNLDGDVTDKIQISGTVDTNTVGTYQITYTVKDSNNNIATLIRTVIVKIIDRKPPVISLVGDSHVSVTQNEVYNDAGATALDDMDGDVTANIQATSDVNTAIIGSYKVTYNVSDSSGNAATPVSRTVDVVSGTQADQYNTTKGVNKPKLATGMTPIKWNGTAWVTTTEDDDTWYDYTNKQWANVKTADGSMWVWIPRYVYKIATANWHYYNSIPFDIKFSIGTDDTVGNTVTINMATGAVASKDTYTNEPAFTFGATELTGIWVAKFEASKDASNNVKVLPNVSAWTGQTINDIFTKVRSMETNSIYGWDTTGAGIDTHLSKNVEWGAVTYLSKSIYGKNTGKVFLNNNIYFKTGCSADTYASSNTGTCSNTYNTTKGFEASTTGTIYGIYDMAGSAYEVTAAYINNGNGSLSSMGNSLYTAPNQYKDIYPMGTTDTAANDYNATADKKGDAMYETSKGYTDNCAWDMGLTVMPYGTFPWFLRGGHNYLGYMSNIFAFGYTTTTGNSNGYIAFRPIIVVDSGL